MKLARGFAIVGMALLVAGCTFENKNERLAHRITSAVMANDVAGVAALFSPKAHITRMTVAQYSYELNAQGHLRSIVQTHPCDARGGWLCFDAVFDKRIYREHMRVNKNGLITDWFYHVATTASPGPGAT